MMSLSEIAFLGIALYLLYRFVFNFLVPVVRTTKQVRRQFRDIHDAMQGQANPFQQQQYTQPEEPRQQKSAPGSGGQPSKENKMGEYIDFEEIK